MNVVECSDGRGLRVEGGPDGATREFFFFWLRDHCRCDACYNHLTFQRKINVTDIPIDIRAKEFALEGETLKIVSLSLGVNMFVPKPVTVTQLVSRLDTTWVFHICQSGDLLSDAFQCSLLQNQSTSK